MYHKILNKKILQKNNLFLEIKRKLFHILLGIIIVLLIKYNLIQLWMFLVLLILGLVISILSRKKSLFIIGWFLKNFDRPEHNNFPGRGVIAILFSSTILVLFRDLGVLSTNIVLASIMIWTFGDSLSSIVGRMYGRIKHPLTNMRFIEGTLAGIVGAILGAYIFIPLFSAIIAGTIAIVLESIEFVIFKKRIDDNLLVPLVAALVLIII